MKDIGIKSKTKTPYDSIIRYPEVKGAYRLSGTSKFWVYSDVEFPIVFLRNSDVICREFHDAI